MADQIVLTWPDADDKPMRIVSSNPVSYEIQKQVIENGKKVIKTTKVEYTACSARPATKAEVDAWKNQP